MKKIIITILAGIMVTMLVTGCGEDKKTTKDDDVNEIVVHEINVETIHVEEIIVEDIIVEETITEETIVESKYFDDEFEKELEYNSQSNVYGWENNDNIQYWD